MEYLRSGKLTPDDLSQGMLKKMLLEAKFFDLSSLKDELEEAMKPDAEIVIDARGTKIRTTRKVITKGKDCRWLTEVETFSSLFDPQSPKLLQAEDDGSYKIDADPRYVEWLLTVCECVSEETAVRVLREFYDKYGWNMMDQWIREFLNKYY